MWAVGSRFSLRARYALLGTAIAYGAIGLRYCYALPGTDKLYGLVRLLRDARYGATRSSS